MGRERWRGNGRERERGGVERDGKAQRIG